MKKYLVSFIIGNVNTISWSPKVARSLKNDQATYLQESLLANAILEKGRLVAFSGIRSWPKRLGDHDSNWTDEAFIRQLHIFFDIIITISFN